MSTFRFPARLFTALTIGATAAGCPVEAPPPDAGPGLVCGAGTVEKDGACIAVVTDGGPDLECGDGTVPNEAGDACVPDLDCAPGTVPNDEGTGCEALCEAPFVYDEENDGCACPEGTIEEDGGCALDPAACGEGTALVDGQCVPLAPPVAGDDEALNVDEVPIELPGMGEKELELGGVVGPVDRVDGPDLDVFTFTATAGTRLLVQAVSFGVPNVAFFVVGRTDPAVNDNIGAFQRYGAPGANRKAVREVVLPIDGTYSIVVTDWQNLAGGFGGAPVGSPDYSYALLVDTIPPAPAVTVPADGAERLGQHDDVDGWRIDPASLPAGRFAVAELDGHESDPTGDTYQVLWWVQDGRYAEALPGAFDTRVFAFVPQSHAGTTVHVDYVYRLGVVDPWEYALTVRAQEVVTGPGPNEEPVLIDANAGSWTFFAVELEERTAYRVRVELPLSSTLNPQVYLVDETLGDIQVCDNVAPDGPRVYQCLRYVGTGEGGTRYVVVADDTPPDPVGDENHKVRLRLEAASVPQADDIILDESATDVARTVAAPADPDAAAWDTPWLLVRVDDVADALTSADAGVTLSFFDALTFRPLPGRSLGVESFLLRSAPGSQVLVQATGGAGEGTFNLAMDVEPSPFGFESEVNNTVETADALPATPPPVVPPALEGDPGFGACDLASGTLVEDSGLWTATLSGDAGNDYDGDNLACGAYASSQGDDFFFRLGDKPPGTVVTARVVGSNIDVSVGYQIGCDATECLPWNDLPLDENPWGGQEIASYVYTGQEGGELLLIVDSFSPEASTDIEVEIVFSNPVGMNGTLRTGDRDVWAFTPPDDGLVTLLVKQGPFNGRPDMEITLLASDGTTVVRGPTLLLLGLYAEPPREIGFYAEGGETYYVALEHLELVNTSDGPLPGRTGDYHLEWSFDGSVAQGPTCEDPEVIETSTVVFGDTRTGASAWAPADDACLGVEPEAVEGAPEAIYAIEVPPRGAVRASLFPEFDAAFALLDGDCAGACLAGDEDFFTEQLVWSNPDDAARQVRLVVDGYAGGTGLFTMTVEIFGSVCRPGETRCVDDQGAPGEAGTTVERCNEDGSAWNSETCATSCLYDPFEETASCAPVCNLPPWEQPAQDPELGPTAECVDNTARVCLADRQGYSETVCEGSCTVDVIDGFPVFASCTD